MRSAQSAIGVSGFLISCAMRRAISCHAAAFCARSMSLVSSSTSTKPEVDLIVERRHRDREVQHACCSVRNSNWLAATPMRRARFIRYRISAVSSGENRSLEARSALHLLGRKKSLQRAVDPLDAAIAKTAK